MIRLIVRALGDPLPNSRSLSAAVHVPMNKHLGRLVVAHVLLLALLLPAGLPTPVASSTSQSIFDCSTVEQIPQAECEALVELYVNTGGDDWSHNTLWLETNTPCTWHGVACLSGRVFSLLLPDNNLVGQVPTEIGALTALQRLDLSANELADLPSQIGDLTALTSLGLEGNPLSGVIPTFLSQLTQLQQFTFYDTDWCVPSTGAVRDWLSGIPTLYGPGLVCGQDLGSLSGTVSRPNSTPAVGMQVSLFRSLIDSQWRYIGATHTANDGSYQFADLGQGLGIDYRVWYVDPTHQLAPQYYGATSVITSATVIAIEPGTARTGIDATLALPTAPLVEVSTSTASFVYGPDGTVHIIMPTWNRSDVAVSREVICASGVPTSVTLDLSTGPSHTMSNVGGNLYSVVVPDVDFSSSLSLYVSATCGATTTETLVGYVRLHERSSTITSERTGLPVTNATVTSYRVPGWLPRTAPDDDRPNTCESYLSKPDDAAWSQPAPTHLGIIPNGDVTYMMPVLPYQRTMPSGNYGWDVGEGCWYVTVEAPGYVSHVSPVVGVPPQVVDLNLVLEPEDNILFLPLVSR